jgi:ribA/ribD-fused uncharacterized protein
MMMTSYNHSWLTDKYNQGERLKYIFFWGHRPRKDGIIGESCFSQWWISEFVVDKVTYKTAEHWMMAEKARLFKDEIQLERILKSKTAAEAKKIGRDIANFKFELWDSHKYQIVVNGNYHKFSQNPDLKNFLVKTNDRIIVEASPVDNIWGIGMDKDDKDILNPTNWRGENLLGFAIMEVRDILKANQLL